MDFIEYFVRKMLKCEGGVNNNKWNKLENGTRWKELIDEGVLRIMCGTKWKMEHDEKVNWWGGVNNN